MEKSFRMGRVSASFFIILLLSWMKVGRSLPRIQERKLKTEESGEIRANPHHFKKFTYNLKNSLSNNEYLKNWLQKEEQEKKMERLFTDAHRDRPRLRTETQPSKLTDNSHKLTAEQREQSRAGQASSAVGSEVAKQRARVNESAADEVQIYYNLQLRRGSASKEKVRNFCLILEERNIFFAKMGRVINETLLNIGTVSTYSAGDYVYKEAFPINSIGIVLWGALLLKYKKCRAKLNCAAGNSIGEEVLFEGVELGSKRYSTVENGRLCSSERCKATEDSGVLFVGVREYGFMHEDLVKWGFKEQMMRLQNILHRNYFKKREFKARMN